MSLPRTLRPKNTSYRKFAPGVDLPCWFNDDLKAIDHKLHIVWHPYRVLWDDIINEYEGTLDDGRFTIHQEHGQENWGFILRDGEGTPIPDCRWHLWRLCDPYGWAHVVGLESYDYKYLKLCLERLNKQAEYRDKYGDHAWNKKMLTDTEEAQTKAQDDQANHMDDVQKENKWLVDEAKDNFSRGVTKPTNPQKTQIMSYPGQSHRSTVKRPITDEEGGLVTE